MTKIICAKEFDICVSMSDVVTWQDGEKTPDIDLQAVFNILGIPANILDLHNLYFAHSYNGTGDVHVYHAENNGGSILAVNMYRDLTDQLDLTLICLRVESPDFELALSHLRSFFDKTKCQVAFEQFGHSLRLHAMLDESRYPRPVEEDNDFMQQ
ncbi:hypothetical protein C1Y08_20735 [Pseudomonas sp. FW306-02-F02-AA]|uniref:Uncharacterized protein n=1 Tax=Pseudomonas fluorescens TaxID=294 RepID=A0A0N7H0Y2_PSEFL|nr:MULTISPECIES: hypothetical protein [Pseudomonas]ALI04412.1 hypothetical protein AO353_26365 [Pseudomonas fluorescens]PMZ03889.1 hypothetical protein C1Y07_11830 [Pseudomonas sp. FW306-02-F02-AB]PMZ08254.1 hypothetical protein C1Y06_20170 [Pseudomonas sp. FW306-02-H06C]PMZ13994.1 hypothetical protein C1Y08_20735 [Pseudomonas sp. FW306-02-F02-AA]PMZ21497.1 hypothetical protein C1Y09_13720 [Pseudomonas sp. FW306-02-F08-AA]